MNRLAAIYSSNLGKKVIAAVTGLILFGFIAGHVAGNLKVFTGSTPEGLPHIDEYAHFLREVGVPLVPQNMVIWTARMVLLVSVILHITVVVQLAMQSSEARPVGYVKTKRKMASPAALYMMFSGGLIAFFIVFHLLHFTVGVVPIAGEFHHGEVYRNLSTSFSSQYWFIALFYIVTMVVLGLHLKPWFVEPVSDAWLGQSRPKQNHSYRFNNHHGFDYRWLYRHPAGIPHRTNADG